MLHSLLIITGLISGSFLNVLIYRLPLHKPFIFARSICTDCKSTIPLYRNIPIISFIIQLGKCHSCNNRISLQYPLVEILTSFLWYWGGTNLILYDAILFILLTNILIVISFIDYRTMEINLKLILLSLIILSIHGIFFTESINNILFGAFVGFGYLGLIYLVTSLIFKIGSTIFSTFSLPT